MDHPYYDSEKRKRNYKFSACLAFVVFMGLIATVIIPKVIAWEERNGYVPVMEREAIPYEPVIIGEHDVLLISNEFDTIHFEMINAYNLASEWEINIKQRR